MTPDTTDTAASGAPEPPAHWSADLREEYLAGGRDNGRVGKVLLSETARVRVWALSLAPGERAGFHRHQLDYFWTVLGPGRARSRYATGAVCETDYHAGMTRHFAFAAGDCMIHDLENIGETTLSFTTVEFLDSANPPLPLG
ncbi:hypothetical protein GLS40_09885 [Pseudooceanicola sp. 216_PA32_1]|uniref:Cupin domain-containing protein n=1 Tax=Pseudooceanicola pacificus TaxID=2676438 RepID=A0A844W5I4_9RHOB|nr:hypothetical protein [Pseudooceanicola pacificus]MWB78335.1 hypothetical protein [Pseudooceanicola pacificus]